AQGSGDACNGLVESDACTVNLPNGNTIQGTCTTIPQGELACVPLSRTTQPVPPNDGSPGQFPPPDGPNGPGGPPPGGGPGGPGNRRSGETGRAGVLRLFEEPLVTEASWLLPLVLLGIPVALTAMGWAWPLDGKHLGLLLWAGWLLPSMAYFSFTTGLFHRYYLIMLGPAIAALVGITFWAVIHHWKRSSWLGWSLMAFITGITITFEIYTFRTYPEYAGFVTILSLAGLALGMGLLALRHGSGQALQKARPLQYAGAALVLAALLAAPFTWSALTTLNTNPDVALPTAGWDAMSNTTFMTPNQELLSPNGEAILDYLLAHTGAGTYLLATNNARGAAPYILETGRPVLTFGGFTGNDDVVDLGGLLEMLDSGELRYILGLPQNKPEIAGWMVDNCSVVDVPGVTSQPNRQPGPGKAPDGPRGQESEVLYDCGG
ncbi:MAG: hypothetical protein ACE5GO_10065, partial [Anaerolineales bacterium]